MKKEKDFFDYILCSKRVKGEHRKVDQSDSVKHYFIQCTHLDKWPYADKLMDNKHEIKLTIAEDFDNSGLPIYTIITKVKFCPFCGFSYQKND